MNATTPANALSRKPMFDQQYAQALLLMAKQRSTEVFNNSKPQHAAVVMENIFRETRKSAQGGTICIYGKNLNGEISSFENYRQELLAFLLAPNTTIKVVVDEIPEPVEGLGNAFEILKAFSKTEIGKKISLSHVTHAPEVAQLLKAQLRFTDIHFAVSTENMYRLELDSKLHFAECSFNGREQSQTLFRVFDEIQTSYAIPIA